MLKARVEIKLKKGIVDPEGKNIKKALNLLQFNEVKNVKVAKVFEIEIEGDDEEKARDRIEAMCRRLLANPVINDYKIDIIREND
ncbi:MAG: phosphoribosylformylglycinamidine synthase subunit PurS [Thermoplasmata archaeon]|nr:phosphoribosylformylglycinamidine synthase subunit PurS [Thermoplasmata archaeon]